MNTDYQVSQTIKNCDVKTVVSYKYRIPYTVHLHAIKIVVGESEDVIICCQQACEYIQKAGFFALTPSAFPQIFANYCKKAPIDIYFVNKKSRLEIPWGTDAPISIQDQVTKIFVNVLAHGQLKLVTSDGKKLFEKLDDIQHAVANDDYLTDFLFQRLLPLIKDLLTNALMHTKENILKACSSKDIISLYIGENLQHKILGYGFKLEKFDIYRLKIEENQQFEQLQGTLQRNEQLEHLSKTFSPDSGFSTINYIETISNCKQVQIGTVNSQQTDGLTATEMQLLFDKVVSSLSNYNLQTTDKEEILSELQKIRAELKKKSPQKAVILNALGTIRNISEGIAGSIIASGLLWKFGLF